MSKRRSTSPLVTALVVLSLLEITIYAGETWQHEVTVDRAPDKRGKPRPPAIASLWIPPRCEHARGSIIGQMTLLEKRLLEDPILRDQLTERRREDPDNLMSMLVHPGADHTSWDDELSRHAQFSWRWVL